MLPRSEMKEIADLPIENLVEYKESVQYFKKTNGLFFNHSLIYKFIQHFLNKKKSINVLDIGTGMADLPVYLSKKFKKQHINCLVTGIDTNAQVIELAFNEIKGYPNIKLLQSSIHDLSERYDIVTASQVFHHLAPQEAVKFLKEAYKKANTAVIISDLIRSRIVYWLVKFFVYATTTNKINRYDGAISVLRCYSDDEIIEFMKKANIKNYKIHNILFRKFIIIAHENRD
jgi:2-polyprenyl-3-methyl-5-hydroxy-6-metoxy-1,4-benzoquinol methylase